MDLFWPAIQHQKERIQKQNKLQQENWQPLPETIKSQKEKENHLPELQQQPSCQLVRDDESNTNHFLL